MNLERKKSYPILMAFFEALENKLGGGSLPSAPLLRAAMNDWIKTYGFSRSHAEDILKDLVFPEGAELTFIDTRAKDAIVTRAYLVAKKRGELKEFFCALHDKEVVDLAAGLMMGRWMQCECERRASLN